MSWGNWLLDKTVGVAWEAATGTVNPWKLDAINRERAAAIARASGVGVGGKTVQPSSEVVTQRQAAAKQEAENYLRSRGEHPEQVDWGLGIAKLRSGIILVLAVAVGVFFVLEFGKAYLSRR